MANKKISTIQLLLTLGGVAVALLNLWAVGKLSPVYQNIAVITTRVDAFEDKQGDLISRNEFQPLKDQVNRIENKLDRALIK